MDKRNKKLFLLSLFFLFGLIVMLFLLFKQIVGAYGPAPTRVSLLYPTTLIEAQVDKNFLLQQKSCLDQNCLFIIEKGESGFFEIKRTDIEGKTTYPGPLIGSVDKEGKTINLFYCSYDYPKHKAPPLNEVIFIEAIDKLIKNDITEIKPIFFREVENWRRNKKVWDGNLVFTPYEQSKESKFLKDKNQLFHCYYTEYKRVGNWIVINLTSRDYCKITTGGEGSIYPHTKILYPKFFAFLLSNINGTTAPYLAIFIAIIIVAALFIGYLIRKRELWFFLKPRKAKVIVTMIAGVLMFFVSMFLFFFAGATGLLNIERFLWYLLLVYLIASLIEYIGLKRKVEPKIG